MRKPILLGLVTLVAIVAVIGTSVTRKSPQAAPPKETVATARTRQPSALQATVKSDPSPTPVAPTRDPSYRTYFERTLMDQHLVAELYHRLTSRLPAGAATELAAIYISEGPVRNGSREFIDFMSELHSDLLLHSSEIHELLTAQDAVFRQDPFIYQMALNLEYQLDLPPEKKAAVLGNAMGIHFASDPDTGVTLMSANITNALILMKNSGVTLEQALPYIRRGLAVNADNRDALNEFIARVNAYYPGAV